MERAKRQMRTTSKVWGKVIAVSSFIAMFLVSVVIRCTGVLYVSWQTSFDSTAAQTAAIASIITSSSYCTSIFAGVFCNRYGCRFTCILGGVLTFFPILMSFWATSLWSMYAVAVFTGVGTSFSFLASNVVLAEYFKTYYAIVSGLTMAGGSTNMIVFPPLLRLLLDAYGWRGAMLVTSAICANLCVVGSLYRPLRHTPRRKTIVTKSTDNIGISPNSNKCSSENPPDSHVQYGPTTSKGKCVTSTASLRRVFSALRLGLMLKSYRFSLLCLTSIQLQMTYSCASVFLVPRAKFSGTDDMKASFLLSTFGFGSLISRVASGFFVTRKTPVEALYTFSFVLCCVGLLSSQAETYASFAASACILGMGTGANKVWSNILIRKLLGLPRVASGQAIHLLLCGVGDLIGPIVAGLLYDSTGSFGTVFYVLAGLVAAAALQMLLMPVLRRIEPGVAGKEETSTGSVS